MMTAIIATEEQLEDVLSTPDVRVIETLDGLSGDLLVLGAAGKIGPGIVRMARRANGQKRIIAVDRFSDPAVSTSLEKIGIEILAGDISEPGFLKNLPRVENVLYLVGRKFGAAGDLPLTWLINTHIAGLVAGQFSGSRIVVFSTGNVYPFVAVDSGGAGETENPRPIGEYAQSCLGRERLFEYFSGSVGVPVFIFRLNYAVELRYGVLLDIALKVWHEQEIDLTMGYFNVIWQGDVNALALRALPLCASPARIVNITGPERLAVRQIATRSAWRNSWDSPPSLSRQWLPGSLTG
jgi:nucleoside-diphosphate-sugar epimerase